MLSLMDVAAILLSLCAVFGWINKRFLPLSRAVGLLLMSVTTSVILLALNALFPLEALFIRFDVEGFVLAGAAVPLVPARPLILTATYAVVLFSNTVQGSTLGLIARRTIKKH